MLQRKGNPIYLVPVPLQKLLEECQLDHRSTFGASLRFFLSGLTPLAFSIHLVTTRQWYYLTHSWGSVHEHQGIFHSTVGLHTACLGADLLRVLVVQPGAVRCPVSCIAAGRHYIGLVKGEAFYWQRETYALGSPLHITASQR